MKFISPKLHGFLDNITIVFLFLSPLIFDLDGVLAATIYVLAVFQFMLTMLTDYEYGIIKFIPFLLHGWVEACIGLLLIMIALFFRHALNQTAFYYCAVLAAVYLLVSLFTKFQPVKHSRNISSVL